MHTTPVLIEGRFALDGAVAGLEEGVFRCMGGVAVFGLGGGFGLSARDEKGEAQCEGESSCCRGE